MQDAQNFQNYSNDRLMDELHAHRKDERRSCVRVLRILEEIDRRKLYAELGYPSLFQFCVSAMHLSEHAAYLRVLAARTGRRFPVVFEILERGELHLTAIKLLAPHLSEENHAALIRAAVHKTKREIEEMLAARFPQPAVSESIRRLPAPAPISTTLPVLAAPVPARVQVPVAAPRREVLEPLSPERYAVRFTASARCRDLIDRAKQLMSHRSPNADVAELVEAGLETIPAEHPFEDRSEIGISRPDPSHSPIRRSDARDHSSSPLARPSMF